MKFIDLFRSGPAAAEKVLDAGIAGIDKIIFTEEEKSDARKALLDSWLKLQEMLGEETSVRGVTRRILAVIYSGTYVFLTLASVAVFKFDKTYADFMWDIAQGTYGTITLTVAAFYFGPYFISQLIGKVKST